MSKQIFTAIFFFCISSYSYPQDLKGGELSVRHITGLTYEATVTLYQNISTFVNRPSIILNWGESFVDTVLSSLTGCSDSNTVTQVYRNTHTYAGAGNDTIWCDLSFRMANIQNIANSINEKLLLKFGLNVGVPGLDNATPVFSNCTHANWGCCNWVYNPGAFDSDHDSLSYKLIQPFTTNYTFPNASINSITGDMTFNPDTPGFYSFCMQIDEWRFFSTTWVLIGTTYRQMQIDVYSLTGINENEVPVEITISPNPFTNETVLTIENPIRNATLRINNYLGQMIRQIDNMNEKSIVLARGNFANGIYFVQLMKDNQVLATKKLIVAE